MGKTISDENQFKESWDSNAITPGTPFMHLLAASLRYWTVHKMNTDSGWKSVSFGVASCPITNSVLRFKSLFPMLAYPAKASTK